MWNSDYNDDIEEDISYTHNYTAYGSSILAPAIIRFGFWCYDIGITIAKSDFVTKLGFRAFWLYCSTMVYLEKKWNYYYNTYEIIRNGVDRFSYTLDIVLGNSIVEPDTQNWCQVCSLLTYDKNQPPQYFGTSRSLDDNLSQDDAKSHFKSVFDSIQESNDAMILMKYQDLYRIKWYCQYFKDNIDIENNLVLSSFKPISITCKWDTNESIDIEIPSSMWCVGNELFTTVFLYRCMKQQNIPFVHSAEYVIEIMDENVETFQIHKDQFIEVCQDSVVVHTIQYGPPELISLEDMSEPEETEEQETEAETEEHETEAETVEQETEAETEEHETEAETVEQEAETETVEQEAETIKLCENMDCERYPDDWDFDEDTEDTYQEGQWKKCCLCDGYFDDDGMSDILFVQEEPNNQEAECDLCGKTEDIVQMKGTGQYLCGNACDKEDEEEDDEVEESSEEEEDKIEEEVNPNEFECDDCNERGMNCYEEIGLTKNEAIIYMDLGEPDRCEKCFLLWQKSNDASEYIQMINNQEQEED